MFANVSRKLDDNSIVLRVRRFVARHKILSSVVFPICFAATYFVSGRLCLEITDDALFASGVCDIVFIFILSIYCRVISLHIPNVKRSTHLPRAVAVLGVCLFSFVSVCVGQVASSCVLSSGVDTSSYTQYNNTIDNTELFWRYLFVIFIAPVFEELLFRKCLFGSLSRCSGCVIAAIISSGLFAISHNTLVHLPMTFMLGMLNCMLYARFGRIGVPMCVHIISNFIATCLPNLICVPDVLAEPVVCAIVYCVLVGVIVYKLTQQPRAIAGYKCFSD